jgi:PAS domain S-box-containing protein
MFISAYGRHVLERETSLNDRSVLDSIYNGIVAVDNAGTISYFNRTAEKIFDIPVSKALGLHILDVLPNTGGKLLESLQTGKSFHGEKLKGQKVALVSNISPILVGGRIAGAISIFQDATEVEEISKELQIFKNMNNWLDTVIDSSYDGLMICDERGKVIRMNKASEKINNLKAGDILGKNVNELVAMGLFDNPVTFEVIKRKSAVSRIQKMDEKGKIKFVVVNERDLTNLDQLRSQIQEVQALANGYMLRISELEMKGVDLSNFIFRSEKIKQVIQMAIKVAEVSSTVFLLGESGVGKGMIAKMIHKTSARNKGPFVRVDCAGIPESLVESELFGYEKGAFTGARTEGKPGLLELANRGTLFLDEIGEIPLSSQSKLLRFLEDHEITRVGGTEPRAIDVRIIAATNRKIGEMVASGSFREDLFYRLNVVPIHIPSLRERQEDILPLIFHFLEKFNQSYKKQKVLSPEMIDCLCSYDYLGNIRELMNILERLVVTSEKEQIEKIDLPDGLMSRSAGGFSIPFLPGSSLRETLRRCELQIIENAIRKYGSQREAAKALKMDQANISRKIKKYSFLRTDAISHK